MVDFKIMRVPPNLTTYDLYYLFVANLNFLIYVILYTNVKLQLDQIVLHISNGEV